nr:SecY-independent transporter protein [Pyropia sp. Myanmar_A]BED43689.1 SecY-independent transporter protein [Pyropia sp. Myanmar_C]
MQSPFIFYLIELKFRSIYFLFSFINCLIIIISYHEAIFFLKIHIFYFINNNNFIAIHIAELFETSMYIAFNLALIINFPFGYYHCSRFFKSSWYKSQTWFFANMQIFTATIFIISIFASYFWFLPFAYKFLDTWSITTNYAFKVQLETRIKTYIYWTFQTAFVLSNLLFVIFNRLTYSYLTDNMINLHVSLREYKKYSILFVCLLTSLCTPSEGFMQLVTSCSLILLLEIFFFVTCVFFAKNNV